MAKIHRRMRVEADTSYLTCCFYIYGGFSLLIQSRRHTCTDAKYVSWSRGEPLRHFLKFNNCVFETIYGGNKMLIDLTMRATDWQARAAPQLIILRQMSANTHGRVSVGCKNQRRRSHIKRVRHLSQWGLVVYLVYGFDVFYAEITEYTESSSARHRTLTD